MASDAYLLDTGVLILYARGADAGEAIEARFQFKATPYRPLVCVVTLGEIWAFARWRQWGERQTQQLKTFLENVVPIDISHSSIIEAYAEIQNHARQKGRALSDNDVWNAAVAHVSGATLLTTDKDFDPLVDRFIERILIDPHTGQVIEH